jgi:hypothetical protein
MGMENRNGRMLLTIPEAAAALGCSTRHIERLIDEATRCRKSRWRFGRELIDLAPLGSQRRMVRVNVGAVVPLTTP